MKVGPWRPSGRFLRSRGEPVAPAKDGDKRPSMSTNDSTETWTTYEPSLDDLGVALDANIKAIRGAGATPVRFEVVNFGANWAVIGRGRLPSAVMSPDPGSAAEPVEAVSRGIEVNILGTIDSHGAIDHETAERIGEKLAKVEYTREGQPSEPQATVWDDLHDRIVEAIDGLDPILAMQWVEVAERLSPLDELLGFDEDYEP